MQGPMDRRDFLSKSTKSVFLMSAAGSTLAARNPVKAIAPSDKVRIAGIGSGGRGSSLVAGFLDHKEVEIAAICDLDPSRGGSLVKHCERRQGKKPARIL